MYVQKRCHWVNWCPAAGSQGEAVVPGAGEAAPAATTNWGGCFCHRQVTPAAARAMGEDEEKHDNRAKRVQRSLARKGM